jgi:hypothetical protein
MSLTEAGRSAANCERHSPREQSYNGRSVLSSLGPTDRTVRVDDDPADDIVYPSTVPFVLVHLACLGAPWTGVTAEALVLCGALYILRIFAIGAGYHRYFAHRTYKTSRAVQFLLALLTQTSAQRGVLWWAAKHRRHHNHSDTEHDVHSPRQHGFIYAHLGWIFTHAARRDRLRRDRRFRPVSGAAVARSAPLPASGAAGRTGVADRRLAGLGGWLLPEHSAALACHLRDRLSRPRRGARALRDRR